MRRDGPAPAVHPPSARGRGLPSFSHLHCYGCWPPAKRFTNKKKKKNTRKKQVRTAITTTEITVRRYCHEADKISGPNPHDLFRVAIAVLEMEVNDLSGDLGRFSCILSEGLCKPDK